LYHWEELCSGGAVEWGGKSALLFEGYFREGDQLTINKRRGKLLIIQNREVRWKGPFPLAGRSEKEREAEVGKRVRKKKALVGEKAFRK